MRIRRPGAGLSTAPITQDKACSSLAGGVRAVPEGLEDSAFPCAKVLSVAGFFAKRLLFPLGGGLFPEEKEPPFLPAWPSLFGKAEITVINHSCSLRR